MPGGSSLIGHLSGDLFPICVTALWSSTTTLHFAGGRKKKQNLSRFRAWHNSIATFLALQAFFWSKTVAVLQILVTFRWQQTEEDRRTTTANIQRRSVFISFFSLTILSYIYISSESEANRLSLCLEWRTAHCPSRWVDAVFFIEVWSENTRGEQQRPSRVPSVIWPWNVEYLIACKDKKSMKTAQFVWMTII